MTSPVAQQTPKETREEEEESLHQQCYWYPLEHIHVVEQLITYVD